MVEKRGGQTNWRTVPITGSKATQDTGKVSDRDYTALTPREREIVSLWARGIVTGELGANLIPAVRQSSIAVYINNIYSHLNAYTPTHAVVRAIDAGRINPEATSLLPIDKFGELPEEARTVLEGTLKRLRAALDKPAANPRKYGLDFSAIFDHFDNGSLPVILCGYLAWKARQARPAATDEIVS